LRKPNKAVELALEIGADSIHDISSISAETDIIIIAMVMVLKVLLHKFRITISLLLTYTS
jgi:hypothetical protein